MKGKTEFIAFRADAEDAKRIADLARLLGSGSKSAAIRWAVRNAPTPGAQQPTNEPAETEAIYA